MNQEVKGLLDEGVQFYTAERVNVNKHIKAEDTVVFNCRFKAENYARQKRSYVYEILAKEKKGKAEFFGWAVPK